MKKLLLASLAVLLMCGIANATGIPQAVEPVNYPTVWTEDVYNGTATAIGTAQVVIWDFDTSDSNIDIYDDMCPWVAVTEISQDPWTAGVTLTQTGIPAYTQGQIIIRGPAVVDKNTADGGGGEITLSADDLVGTHTRAGEVTDVSANSGDQAYLGVVIKNSAANQGYDNDALIFVNPTLSFDD